MGFSEMGGGRREGRERLNPTHKSHKKRRNGKDSEFQRDKTPTTKERKRTSVFVLLRV